MKDMLGNELKEGDKVLFIIPEYENMPNRVVGELREFKMQQSPHSPLFSKHAVVISEGIESSFVCTKHEVVLVENDETVNQVLEIEKRYIKAMKIWKESRVSDDGKRPWFNLMLKESMK